MASVHLSRMRHVVDFLVLIGVLVAVASVALSRASASGATGTSQPTVAQGGTSEPALAAPNGPLPTPPLPPDVQAQLAALGPGYEIVGCSPSEPRYEVGNEPRFNPGWFTLHPAWRVLHHGYCADNPSATPIPVPIVPG
jgi:hypothetical protein